MATHAYKLRSPIKFGDKTITEIRYRDPTVADLEAIGGFFYTVDTSGELSVTPRKVVSLLGQITEDNLPPSAIKQMSVKDFDALRWILLKFFPSPDLSASDFI